MKEKVEIYAVKIFSYTELNQHTGLLTFKFKRFNFLVLCAKSHFVQFGIFKRGEEKKWQRRFYLSKRFRFQFAA